MAKIVVVFDFDKTIIDCDSDDWVVEQLGLTDLFDELLPTMSWNTLMNRMLKEVHSNGRTIEEIAECLKRVPLNPRIISAIKSSHVLGCDLRIVSDANVFFIETILKHHGLTECFSEINTNPSFIDEEGRLNISPYQDLTSSPHCCDLCPLNMCKGLIINRIRDETFTKGKNRFIYLGDGKGDFCPSLKLTETDFMMPRKNYPAWELICSHQSLVKAKVHEWTDGEELEMILLELINKIIIDEKRDGDHNGLISTDCKPQSFPIGSHESFPKPLPVHN